MNRLPLLRALVALLVTSIAIATVAAGRANSATQGSPTVTDGLSAMYLEYTAWFDQNDLDPLGAVCVGVGAPTKGVTDTEHTTFRCTVTRATRPAGVVIATALGPEWLKVAKIISGNLKPDRGIGAVPNGPLVMGNYDAEPALARSSWAHAKNVVKALCVGVGPYKNNILGRQYGAFSCATYDSAGKRAGTVLVQVISQTSIRVVRQLS
jgi:hypothetical protein